MRRVKPTSRKKPVASARKKPVARTKPAVSARKPPAPRKPARRADYGAPIDGFFARQPAHLRAILVELRALIDAVAPEATASIKWGMPFYTLAGANFCALGAHKAHVNLILSGPSSAFVDPDGRLSGDGRIGRHLKLTSVDELPRADVRRWLRAAKDASAS